MRKWISYIALLAMINGMNTAVVAEETTPEATNISVTQPGTTAYVSVIATYQPREIENVYCVDMEWTAMNFTYDAGSKGTWNAQTHQYENADTGEWTADSQGTITIKNRSNVGVQVTIAYMGTNGYQNAQILISDSAANFSSLMTENLASADNSVDEESGLPIAHTYTVKPSGTLPEGTTNAAIGTLTVSFANTGN